MSGGMYGMVGAGIGAAFGGGLVEMATARMAAQFGQMMNTFLTSYTNLAWTQHICPARRLPRPASVERINRRLVARLLDVAIVSPRTSREQYLEKLVDSGRNARIVSDRFVDFDAHPDESYEPFDLMALPNKMSWRRWADTGDTRLNGIYGTVRLPLWLPGRKPKRIVANVKGNVNGKVWWRDYAYNDRVMPFAFVCYSDGELHCNHGPATYDGEQCRYYLHNVEVPDWLITTPASRLDPARFTTIFNAEVRREFVRKVGIDMIIQRCGATTIDKQGDYELLSLSIPETPAAHELFMPNWRIALMEWRYLKMKNPSIGTWHVEGVPNQCRTVMDALRWREPEALQRIPRSENGQPYQQQGDVYIWPKDAKFLKSMPEIVT